MQGALVQPLNLKPLQLPHCNDRTPTSAHCKIRSNAGTYGLAGRKGEACHRNEGEFPAALYFRLSLCGGHTLGWTNWTKG